MPARRPAAARRGGVSRLAALPLLLLLLAGCAARAGLPADALPAAPPAATGAEPPTPGIVPLTLEQARALD